jgi:hypothetical protein
MITQLENKVLYIPEFSVDSDYAKKLMKKGKFEDLQDLEARIALDKANWTEAMAMSSYDATPYEIRGFDRRKLVKEKNEKALLLTFGVDDFGNRSVALYVTGPKKQVIATTLINGMDLSEPSEIRLMMNMLNYVLNENIDLSTEGKKANNSNMRSKYKENLVAFGADLDKKTFLVTPVEHKKPEKAAEMNKELKKAISYWNISEVELITKEELENYRAEEDKNSYYLRNFPVYMQYGITMNFNVLLTTAGDEMIVGFLGSKKVKASKIESIQEKILKKIAKFKKDLD